jgi:hypothetical protein
MSTLAGIGNGCSSSSRLLAKDDSQRGRHPRAANDLSGVSLHHLRNQGCQRVRRTVVRLPGARRGTRGASAVRVRPHLRHRVCRRYRGYDPSLHRDEGEQPRQFSRLGAITPGVFGSPWQCSGRARKTKRWTVQRRWRCVSLPFRRLSRTATEGTSNRPHQRSRTMRPLHSPIAPGRGRLVVRV